MNYTIQKGDTLWGLSKKWGIPLEQLLAQVPESVRRDPRKLMPGMQLENGLPPSVLERRPAPESPADKAARLGTTLMTERRGITENERQDQFRKTREEMGAALASPPSMALGEVAGGAVLGPLARGLGSIGRKTWDTIKTPYKEIKGIFDDAAAARRIEDRMDILEGNAAGRALTPDGPYDSPTFLRQLGLLGGSRPQTTITPNLERLLYQQMRQREAQLASAGRPNPARVRSMPDQIGTTLRPHPDRGTVAAPARDISRALEANPNMTLGELPGWLRNNPRP